MRKLVCVLLFVCITISFATAEDIDLSGMTIEELALLRDRCQMMIMKADKWQEVTVPAGLYQIGKEIPAGYWTIKPVDGQSAYVQWGTKLNESGAGLDIWDSRFCITSQITSPQYSRYEFGDVENVSWDLKEGNYIVISESAVIFSPYAGVSFSFN